MGITIKIPKEFSFKAGYRFLDRSDKECLHRVNEGKVYKLLLIDGELLLIQIEDSGDALTVNCINKKVNNAQTKAIKSYVIEWWDLDYYLKPFYRFCKKDKMLKKLSDDHHGLRMIGFPDLLECLVWAIIGQQINLNFAYIIKRRFVEKYGISIVHQGQSYFHFPDAESVSQLTVEALKELKFSRQKANYTLNVANAILHEGLNKNALKEMGYAEAKATLKNIKGVGDWTADYALMKCIRYPNAIPLGDVGLHNALKAQLKLEAKPSKVVLKQLAEKWAIHSGYVCFYLWSSLLNNN